MFLIAPPKPATSWPLKWESAIMAFASTIPAAMLTALKCFLSITTFEPRRPARPSAMWIGQFTVANEKPCSYATVMWSIALARLPL